MEMGMGILMGLELFLLAGVVVFLGVWVWALVDIITSRFREDLMQIVWLLVVILLPLLGVVIYLLIGRSMKRTPPRESSDPDTRYDRLSKLKGLLDGGAITPEEYEAEKARILRD